MYAPGSVALAGQISDWSQESDGNFDIVEDAVAVIDIASAHVHWLEATWGMIEATLTNWTVADLAQTNHHTWNGQTYMVSRQWTLWRILSHDLHHGGELALLLSLQGIDAFEVKDLLGHITLPLLAV